MLALAPRADEPLKFVEAAMAAFDAELLADPENSDEARAADRDHELLEQEVA